MFEKVHGSNYLGLDLKIHAGDKLVTDPMLAICQWRSVCYRGFEAQDWVLCTEESWEEHPPVRLLASSNSMMQAGSILMGQIVTDAWT